MNKWELRLLRKDVFHQGGGIFRGLWSLMRLIHLLWILWIYTVALGFSKAIKIWMENYVGPGGLRSPDLMIRNHLHCPDCATGPLAFSLKPHLKSVKGYHTVEWTVNPNVLQPTSLWGQFGPTYYNLIWNLNVVNVSIVSSKQSKNRHIIHSLYINKIVKIRHPRYNAVCPSSGPHCLDLAISGLSSIYFCIF